MEGEKTERKKQKETQIVTNLWKSQIIQFDTTTENVRKKSL